MTTTTQTLASWLLEQIAADEAHASGQGDFRPVTPNSCGFRFGDPERVCLGGEGHMGTHVLAVCAAHRAIVELWRAADYAVEQVDGDPWKRDMDRSRHDRELALRALAQAYADRPGWREEWAA